MDDCLTIVDGRLFVEGCDAGALAARFGTPLHVVSEDQLRRNVRRFAAAFGEGWPDGPVRILPSIKANLVLALRRIVTQEGAGCDTFGLGELHAALASGVPPAWISVNGTAKDAALVDRAVAAGARITLDAAAELPLIADAARRRGVRAKVRFRMRPDFHDLDALPSDWHEGVSVRQAAQRYKAGIPTEDLIPMGRRALATPEVEVTGLHVHLGRQRRDLETWRGMANGTAALVSELSRAWDGWLPGELDVGGGFATRRDPFGRAHAPAAEPSPEAPSIEAYAEALTSALRAAFAAHGIEAGRMALEVEPGRSLYADTGVHLTTVRGVKVQTRPVARRWVETDTTEMFLPDGLIEGNRWTPVVTNRADSPPVVRADVVGLSCGLDVLVGDAPLPEVRIGDVMAFLDTGAYQDAASSNFNALPRPATVLVHGGEAEIVKRAETIEDVFARDIVPERLA